MKARWGRTELLFILAFGGIFILCGIGILLWQFVEMKITGQWPPYRMAEFFSLPPMAQSDNPEFPALQAFVQFAMNIPVAAVSFLVGFLLITFLLSKA